MPNDVGLTLVSTGVGFQSVTVLFPIAIESTALTASISTDPEFGRLEGAVYFPAEVIAPVLEDPPATLFTSQVTLPFEAPVTCAVNVWVEPARTSADEGVTLTVISGGGFFPVKPEDALPQLICRIARTSAMTSVIRRKVAPGKSPEARRKKLGILLNSLMDAGWAGQLSKRTVLGQGRGIRGAKPILKDRQKV